MAHHGYLPEDPHESLARCYAAFSVAASELDRVVGAERAFSFGAAVGEYVGSVVTQLRYLYPERRRTLQQVQERAGVLERELTTIAAARRRATLQAYVSDCRVMGVPVPVVLKGFGIVLQ